MPSRCEQGYNLYKHFERLLTRNNFLSLSSAPVKVRALHMCTGSGKGVMDLVLPVLKQMAGKNLRLCLHLHSGSDNELLSRLEDFGLGEMHAYSLLGRSLENREKFSVWLAERLALEQEREGF
jgi:hypothetical protein